MTVSESEDWVIPHAAIVLESLLTSGRFADIYKVRYNPKKGSPGDMFVAKLLKSKKTLPSTRLYYYNVSLCSTCMLWGKLVSP